MSPHRAALSGRGDDFRVAVEDGEDLVLVDRVEGNEYFGDAESGQALEVGVKGVVTGDLLDRPDDRAGSRSAGFVPAPPQLAELSRDPVDAPARHPPIGPRDDRVHGQRLPGRTEQDRDRRLGRLWPGPAALEVG